MFLNVSLYFSRMVWIYSMLFVPRDMIVGETKKTYGKSEWTMWIEQREHSDDSQESDTKDLFDRLSL
jgi:hypothetical protein